MFKSGDRVRWMTPYGYYAYGEVTIAREEDSKVLFNEEFDYTYYPNKELELITPEDTNED